MTGNGTLDKLEISEAMRAMGRTEAAIKKAVSAMSNDEIGLAEFLFLARDRDGIAEDARKKRAGALARAKLKVLRGKNKGGTFAGVATPGSDTWQACCLSCLHLSIMSTLIVMVGTGVKRAQHSAAAPS